MFHNIGASMNNPVQVNKYKVLLLFSPQEDIVRCSSLCAASPAETAGILNGPASVGCAFPLCMGLHSLL